MSRGSDYNLGINISARRIGIQEELRAAEAQFERFSQNIRSKSQQMREQSQAVQKTKQQEINKTKEDTQAKEDNSGTINNNTKAKKQNTGATDNWLSSNTRSIGIAIKSTAVWAVATTTIYGTIQAMREATSVIRDVDTEMVALQRVMNDSITDFQQLESSAAELGVTMAENVDTVVESMVGWARQGREQIEVVELTEAALLATNVAQMDAAQSVDLLTSALLQFNMEASDAIEIVDRLNEVANNYAVTAEDLAMSIRESGAAANSAGVSMDELIGMTTALSATTAKTGNRIGRSLRTIFSRLLGDTADAGEALGQVEVSLNNVGIALRQSETEYRDLTDVLTDLASQWHTLDGVMQANIARAIGGRRRYSDIIALMENWDMALDATISSMNSLNSAMEENEIYIESVEARFKSARAEFERAALAFGEAFAEDAMKSFADTSRNVFAAIGDLGRGIGELIDKYDSLNEILPVTETLSISLAVALSTKLLPAIGAIIGGFALTPIGAFITALGTGVTVVAALTTELGKQARKTKEVNKAVEELNNAKENANKLSTLELQNAKDTISEYENMINKHYELADTIEQTQRDVGVGEFFHMAAGSLFGDFDRFADYLQDLWDNAGAVTQMEMNIGELREAFSELSEEYEDNEDFLTMVIAELRGINTEIENSIGWMQKYTRQMVDNTRQGYREVQMLESQRQRYHELNTITDKTLEQEIEMRDLMVELASGFYELEIGADNFGAMLNQLVEDQMQEYGREGTKVSETMRQLEQDLVRISEAQPELAKEFDQVGREISDMRQELEDLEEGTPEWHRQVEEINSTVAEYERLGDQLGLTSELQAEFTQALQEFEEGMQIDTDLFLSNFQDAINVLREFDEELRVLIDDLDYLDTRLQRDLEFDRLMSNLLDENVAEQLERELDSLESFADEAEGILYELWTLDTDDPEVIRQIKDVVDEMEGIEFDDLDLDVDMIKSQWDKENFEEVRQQVIARAEETVQEYYNRAEEKSDELELAQLILTAMDYDRSKITEMSDDTLDEAIEIFNKVAEQKSDDITNIFGQGLELDMLGDPLQSEKAARNLSAELTNILEEVGSTLDPDFELPDLTDVAAQERIHLLSEELYDLFDVIEDINSLDSIGEMSAREIEELQEQFGLTSEELIEIQDLLEGLDDFEAVHRLDEDFYELAQSLDISVDKLIKLNEEYNKLEREAEIRSAVLRKEIQMWDDYESQILQLSTEMEEFKGMLEDVADEELANRIKALIAGMNEELTELQALLQLEEWGLEGIESVFEGFDISEITNLNQAQSQLEKFQNTMDDFDNIMERLAGSDLDLSDEQLENIEEGLLEAFISAIEDTEEYIENTKHAWYRAAREGIVGYIDSLEQDDNLVTRVEKLFGAGVSAAFSNLDDDEIRNQLDNLFTSDTVLGDLTQDIADELTEGVMAFAEELHSGSSLGRSVTTGLGTLIGTYFGSPEAGRMVGEFAGSILESIFGGTTGEEVAAEAEQINDSIKDTEKALLDYGIAYDTVYADIEDKAGFFQSLFGGEDWDVSGLEDAEANLEEMQTLLNRIESTADRIGQGLATAITDATNYRDMYTQFRQSVGEALIDAMVDKWIESQLIKEQIDQLAVDLNKAVEEGTVDAFIDGLDDNLSTMLDGAEEYRRAIEGVQQSLGMDVNQRQSTTYRAGDTRTLSIRNTYTVQAGVFMGNESEAREFAKKVSKYVHKDTQQAMGH